MSRSLLRCVLLPALLINLIVLGVFARYHTTILAGQVLDAQDSRPVAGAHLAGAGQAQTSDAAGRFTFMLESRSIALHVRAAGYLPLEAVCTGSPFVRAGAPCLLALQPAVLRLAVVDAIEPGRSVAGVQLAGAPLDWQADGPAHFMALRAAPPLELRVQAPGYQPARHTLGAGDALSLTLPLQPISLHGAVRAADTGAPLEGVEIGPHGWPATRSDAQGRFVLWRVPQDVPLSAQREGYWPAHAIQAHDELEIALEPRIVQGRLGQAGSGAPVAGALLHIGAQETRADANGLFVLRSPQPGETLTIEAAGYLSRMLAYAGEGALALSLDPLFVELRVTDALSGRPLAGAEVHASPKAARSDAEGLCRLAGVAPGATLHVLAAGHQAAEVLWRGEARMEVALLPTGLALRVLAPIGQAPAGLRLLYEGRELPAESAGRYYLADWAPGQTFTLLAPGYRRERFQIALPLDLAGPLALAAEAGPAGEPAFELCLTPFQAQGIYISYGLLAQPEAMDRLLRLIETTELNALVVDMKGDRGYLAYPSAIPLAKEIAAVRSENLMDVRELLRRCQEAGIYTIARIVVFKDHPLATARPAWAVQQADGTAWIDRERLGWANPYRQEVWDYNIAIAVELAGLGFDEIQLDYVRFPSDGKIKEIVYGEQEHTPATRAAAIAEFVGQMSQALRPLGVFLSADVFGLTVWVEPDSEMGIGQRVRDIGPLVDYLCPMVYPSTFASGNLGYDDPSAHPYDVIFRSVQRAQTRLPASALVRPWLQAYWYSVEQQQLQKHAAGDALSAGWCYWNAGGKYSDETFSGAEP